MMILRATNLAIQQLLQDNLEDIVDEVGVIPVYVADESETKQQMPYIVVKCVSSEEDITPGSGIFRVSGELLFRSHTKETSPEQRQTVLDAINNFAYDSTAAKLSGLENFHCHGWHPTSAELTSEPETKSYAYDMKYFVHCMAMDNA